MKTIIAICCIMSTVRASLITFAPAVSSYHTQDQLGQYSYGYSGGPSVKHEIKTADGITQGGYSYIDANNIIQSVSYVSDPINGFRVAATNVPQESELVAEVAAPTIPQDTPEVAAAKVAHLQAHAAAKAQLRKRRSVVPVLTYAAVAPVISTQYQTQDSLGQYSYGYSDGLSVKAEARSLDGTTNGGYSYVDANGIVQNVQYIADANGFRTVATNIPVAPVASAPEVAVEIEETPEVIAAKTAHFAAHAEAKARLEKA